MQQVKINCPSCGTRFSYDGDDEYVTCPKCGRSVLVKRH